jgi:DNA-binding HxlR family transcriptional regulator
MPPWPGSSPCAGARVVPRPPRSPPARAVTWPGITDSEFEINDLTFESSPGNLPVVAGFRYAQFCPLARAAEILGHRWVLLIVRELLLGPQRFTDLRRRLHGVSTSVLADRLALLEAHGVVARRELPAPAGSTVYELTETGRALEPAVVALARWGLHFSESPKRGDRFEPAWLGMALRAYARRGPTPPRRYEIVARGDGPDATLRFAGGPDGTRALAEGEPVDLRIEAPAFTALGLMAGLVDPAAAVARGHLRLQGDPDLLRELPELFDMTPSRPNQPGDPA